MKKVIFAIGVCVLLSAIGAVHDVREFGAKGDGIAKDTAAIQKAVDAAPIADKNIQTPIAKITFFIFISI